MNDLTAGLDHLLRTWCSPAQVRDIERGASADALWTSIEAFGLLDSLVPEERGGAGLGLRDLREVVMMVGERACPIALADTLMARALLSKAGYEPPSGQILLLTPLASSDGYQVSAAPFAARAGHALVEIDGRWLLTDLAQAERVATGIPASLVADVRWTGKPVALHDIEPTGVSLRMTAATLRAAEMAGAMNRILSMTVDYAGARMQFGRPIGRLQAVQQQLAVLAELVLDVATAVGLAFAEDGHEPRPLMAALAKQRASTAVPTVTAIAHAVHGAIGLSEEYDLQIYSRRLYEWRLDQGGEDYWSRVIGEACLLDTTSTIDTLRLRFSPTSLG